MRIINYQIPISSKQKEESGKFGFTGDITSFARSQNE